MTNDQMLAQLDAYGHLTWTIGDMDWMACFDAIREDDRIAYHAVVNCESGGFIDTIEKGVIPVSEAAKLLDLPEQFVDAGMESHLEARQKRQPVGRFTYRRCVQQWRRHIKKLMES